MSNLGCGRHESKRVRTGLVIEPLHERLIGVRRVHEADLEFVRGNPRLRRGDTRISRIVRTTPLGRTVKDFTSQLRPESEVA